MTGLLLRFTLQAANARRAEELQSAQVEADAAGAALRERERGVAGREKEAAAQLKQAAARCVVVTQTASQVIVP